MNFFEQDDLATTAEQQRADNAQAGFKTVVEEYRDHSLAMRDLAELAALTELCPHVSQIAEEAAVRRLSVLEESKRIRSAWFWKHPETLEALNELSATLEARTQELRTFRRMENRVLMALNMSLTDPDQRVEAWQLVLEAYFLIFPDRLPTPVGPKGSFTLTARVLLREIRASDFTSHESAEVAKLHAEAIAAARGAPLEPWDTWIHPDGEQVYRTLDESGYSYRISPSFKPVDD